MDKITIVSIFDKNEDFIKLQYNSILKHVKGDYEYIVFNNASTEEQSDKIENICNELYIKCIRIHVSYNQTPSYIAGNSLNESFKHLSDKIVFKLDSDMFFISDINLFEICNNHDLFYIMTHNTFMWSAVFSINMKKIKDFNLYFNPNVIPNTDTFGQSSLLTDNPNYTKRTMFLFCILDETNGVINGLINNDCKITLTRNEILYVENDRYVDLHPIICDKLFDIYKTVVDYNFPKPYHIDIITVNDVDTIIHYKSSNHWEKYDDLDYVKNKKISLINILKNT